MEIISLLVCVLLVTELVFFVNKMFNTDGVWKWGEIFEDVKIWFVIPSPCV